MLLLSRKQSILVHKAQPVAPRIFSIERQLAPGSFHNFACGSAMNIVLRQAIEFLGSFIHLLEIADREIDVVRNWLWLKISGGNVDQRQNHRTAVEIVSRAARYPATGIVKQLSVERRRLIQVGYLQSYAEQFRNSHRNPP